MTRGQARPRRNRAGGRADTAEAAAGDAGLSAAAASRGVYAACFGPRPLVAAAPARVPVTWRRRGPPVRHEAAGAACDIDRNRILVLADVAQGRAAVSG